MQEEDLTPWFDGKKHKPARRGVYMLMSGNSLGYQKWDGQGWLPWSSDVLHAAAYKDGEYVSQQYRDDNWRGLKKRPNVGNEGLPKAVPLD